MTRVLNTTDGPLITDPQGHTVGGHEVRDVDAALEPACTHLAAGRLLAVADEPPAPVPAQTSSAPAAPTAPAPGTTTPTTPTPTSPEA